MPTRRFRYIAPEPAPREITLAGRPVTFTLKRSPRAAAWRLEFNPSRGLTVVLPRRFDDVALATVLADKQHWILKRLDEAESRARVIGARRLRPGGAFLVEGEDYVVGCEPALKPKGTVVVAGRALRVACEPADNAALRAAVSRWLRRRARALVAPLAAAEAAALGVDFARIYIRDQRTRWASCSANGNLSFSCRLAMMPAAVSRYLVVHELVHLKTMRHGKRFRQLLTRRYPDWREAERWLRVNEGMLYF